MRMAMSNVLLRCFSFPRKIVISAKLQEVFVSPHFCGFLWVQKSMELALFVLFQYRFGGPRFGEGKKEHRPFADASESQKLQTEN